MFIVEDLLANRRLQMLMLFLLDVRSLVNKYVCDLNHGNTDDDGDGKYIFTSLIVCSGSSV